MTRNKDRQLKWESQNCDNSVSTIIGDLEKEVNTLLTQKIDQRDRLAAAVDKLSSESALRIKMEARIKFLESRADSAEELRREAATSVQERKRICRVIKETKVRFSAVTAERDSLVKKVTAANESIREIQTTKTEVERLRSQIADISLITDKLAGVEQERSLLDEKVQDLTRNLAESHSLSTTLKLNLDSTRQVVRDMYSQRKSSDSQTQLLQKKVDDAGTKLSEMQNTIASHTAENNRLERELKVLTDKHETACAARDAANEMYRNLRDGATRIIERTRMIKYEGSNEHEDNNQEPILNGFARRQVNLTGT